MSRIVFFTDVHLLEGKDGPGRLQGDLREIAALQPDLLVCGGDMSLWSEGAGPRLVQMLEEVGAPCLYVMGNHDTTLDVPEAEYLRDFEALCGPVNRHLQLGGAHIVALNTCEMDPAYRGSRDWHNVRARVRQADLAWLRGVLEKIEDRRAPLLVFVHIPLLSTYPGRRGATPADCAVWVVDNGEEVLDCLRPFANCMVFQGHLHENEHLHREGVHCASVGAIAGAWWSNTGFCECPDGAPRGYLLIDVEGEDLRLEYRAAGCSPLYRACVFAREGRHYLNVFFGDPAAEVQLWQKGKWVRLEHVPAMLLRDEWTSTHVWALPAGVEAPVRARTWLRGREVAIEGAPFIADFMHSEADRNL